MRVLLFELLFRHSFRHQLCVVLQRIEELNEKLSWKANNAAKLNFLLKICTYIDDICKEKKQATGGDNLNQAGRYKS